MKNTISGVFTLLCLNLAVSSSAQVNTYTTHGGELIFSFANYEIKGQEISTPLRFTCFFHAETNRHMDFGNYMGIYTGLGIRNVGFTATKDDTMWKRRNYYIGIPLAIKIGNMADDNYFYGGVEGELGLNYKEKLFVSEKKISKFNVWFSDRTPTFMPSAFVGINTKGGFNLRFKYYFYDFLKKDYVEQGVKIYENTKSNIYYFFFEL